MRGGYVHNLVLLDPIAKKAKQLGSEVICEVPIKVEGRVLYGDLLIQNYSKRILVEAEMTSRRVTKDLLEAQALGDCELWIVAPNSDVACSVRRKLVQQPIKLGVAELFIFTLPQAIQRLEHLFELISGSNAASENKKENLQNLPQTTKGV